MQAKPSTYSILIYIGILFIVTGIVIISVPKKGELKKSVDITVEKTDKKIDPIIKEASDQAAFSRYVNDKFSKKYFVTSEPSTSIIPGLKVSKIDYELVGKKGGLIISAQWVKQTQNGMIQLLSEKEMEIIKSSVNQNQTPVFKVLGVGGTPSNPKMLYIVPFNRIEPRQISLNQLNPYKKENMQANFFFDSKEKSLR